MRIQSVIVLSLVLVFSSFAHAQEAGQSLNIEPKLNSGTPLLSQPNPNAGIFLRHTIVPGLKGVCETSVKMKGDSTLLGEPQQTDMNIHMTRSLSVTSVDALGSAQMEVLVNGMRTHGTMGKSRFEQDLSGEELRGVMFGQTRMPVTVTPTGEVGAGDGLDLSSMGMSGLGDLGGVTRGGGFEFPTFPNEAVRVGQSWNEYGEILGPRARPSDVAGDPVYTLRRLYTRDGDRYAQIHYKKRTSFGSMNMGGASSSAVIPAGVPSANALVDDLVVELEGLIEFNIDKGLVRESRQKGTWNLDMNSQGNQQNKMTRMQQSMNIEIHSGMHWSKVLPNALP